jgi:hypothetical protein
VHARSLIQASSQLRTDSVGLRCACLTGGGRSDTWLADFLTKERIKMNARQLGLWMGLCLCTSQFALASDGALVEVKKNSGFVMPDYRYSLDCQIYDSYTFRRLVTGASGKEEVKVEKTVFTAAVPSKSAALELVQEAAKGSLLFRDGPTDGPTTTVTGILEGPVVDQHVKLLKDFSSSVWTNSAQGVQALIEFADLNCPAPQWE